MPVISLSPSFFPKPPLSVSSVADGSRPSASQRSGVFGRVRVIRIHVEKEARVERIPLPVECVAGILDERDLVLREEGRVVEASVGLVALVEKRQLAGRRGRIGLPELLERRGAVDRRVVRGEIARLGRYVAVDEAVRHPRRSCALVGAPDVFDDPDVSVGVVLDSLVASTAERTRDVMYLRRIAGGRRVGRRVLVLGREQEPPRPRIPSRTVDVGEPPYRPVSRERSPDGPHPHRG